VSLLELEYRQRRTRWSDVQGHLQTLYESVCRHPKARVLELGTREGYSTAALLAAAEMVDGHVWSVDLGAPSVPAWWGETGRWTLTVGDDLDPAVADAQPAELDVLFIDTSHTYDQTLDELRLYVPRVRPGGRVLLHDTELDGPDRGYIRPGGTDVPFPVARALDDFCAGVGLAWENHTGSYGLGVIDVPPVP
jgi:predicted O-methyltransferase YrrM